MDVLRAVSLLAATVSMGLVAGVFGLYAHTIVPGLARTDDRTFVGAFQSIDRAILNPWFLGGGFIGALAFIVADRAARQGAAAVDRRRPRAVPGRGRDHRRGQRAAQRRPQGGRRSGGSPSTSPGSVSGSTKHDGGAGGPGPGPGVHHRLRPAGLGAGPARPGVLAVSTPPSSCTSQTEFQSTRSGR